MDAATANAEAQERRKAVRGHKRAARWHRDQMKRQMLELERLEEFVHAFFEVQANLRPARHIAFGLCDGEAARPREFLRRRLGRLHLSARQPEGTASRILAA